MENALNYLIQNQFIASLVALPIAVGLNVLLGYALANFKQEVDRAKLWLGIKKGIVVYFSIAVLSGLAQFVKFADIELISTMSIVVYGVMAVYIVQDLDKIKTILGYKPSESE